MLDKKPLLKPIDTCCLESYINLSEINECQDDRCIDYLRERYPSNILDIFELKLERDDPDLEKLYDEYYRLSVEERYLDFIEECFKINNYTCIVQTGILGDKYEHLLNILNEMDKIDQYLFLYQIQHLWPKEYEYFAINDINLLKMLLRGVLREYFHAEIYFLKHPMILFSNFDLSLPVIFKNTKSQEKYRQLALENNLYLR